MLNDRQSHALVLELFVRLLNGVQILLTLWSILTAKFLVQMNLDVVREVL